MSQGEPGREGDQGRATMCSVLCLMLNHGFIFIYSFIYSSLFFSEESLCNHLNLRLLLRGVKGDLTGRAKKTTRVFATAHLAEPDL